MSILKEFGKKSYKDLFNKEKNFYAVNFSNTKIQNQYIANVSFDVCTFRHSNFKHTEFSNCNFDSVDWFGSNIEGCAFIGCDFYSSKSIMQFGPIGYNKRIGYAVLHKNNVVMVKLGCFWGTQKKAIEAIEDKYLYGDAERKNYIDLVNLNCKILKDRGQDV